MMAADDIPTGNIDPATVAGFGREWATFDQTELDEREHARLFDDYFSIFPFDTLPEGAEGFDLGCGSGRWAVLMAPRVGRLHCFDPSEEAVAVARRRLKGVPSVDVRVAAADSIPLPDSSQDFGYSLGVLHHIPDTEAAMRDCVRKLRIGAPFLVYLYYSLDNRPAWFRLVWKGTDGVRRIVSKLPFRPRRAVSDAIAASVYWPLARLSRLGERLGANVSNLPLSAYRDCSFYTMRTDALDRFGTRLEHRFSKAEIQSMMVRCGLGEVRFRAGTPFWVACGRRAS